MKRVDQPLVSIITPCYNGEDYLDRYFGSILNQTYPNLELIFINDGSKDRTEQIAQNYRPVLEQRGIRYTYLSQENAGQAAALNRGLKLFTGEYLTWPDSDDEMTPDCIEKKVAYLQAHPEVEMCICKIEQFMEGEPQKSIGLLERVVPDGEDNLFEDLIYVRNVFFAPGGYMVRTSALDEAVPGRDIFDGRGGQNAQILLPIANRGRFGYMDNILYKYYVRSTSHSHSINDTVKVIRQLDKYEIIVLETLKRISVEVYKQYASEVKKFYARWRFGNALDTTDVELINKCYAQLRRLDIQTFADWVRCKKSIVLSKCEKKKHI